VIIASISWRRRSSRRARCDFVAQRFAGETRDDRFEEAQRDHAQRVVARDPAAAGVEQRVLVERADRRAVERLDVVGRDLERRDRVDVRVLGEQQRVVAQRGVAAVRLFMRIAMLPK
jgi:hypothetical protein